MPHKNSLEMDNRKKIKENIFNLGVRKDFLVYNCKAWDIKENRLINWTLLKFKTCSIKYTIKKTTHRLCEMFTKHIWQRTCIKCIQRILKIIIVIKRKQLAKYVAKNLNNFIEDPVQNESLGKYK